ncbi:hypothetical protein L596_016714 [Steinernema carpocapsae]|uniref:Nematode cuticle collagen N-terminal domain-containing protein n=1 Tax=Steinernema carpocapsae TaxID=34508 RepID=A0A4U5NK54_STECR|nr:hypothetical protein L596_016714 [Steinernema carpocapsae]
MWQQFAKTQMHKGVFERVKPQTGKEAFLVGTTIEDVMGGRAKRQAGYDTFVEESASVAQAAPPSIAHTCSCKIGPAGSAGASGPDGQDGQDGLPGPDGQNGPDAKPDEVPKPSDFCYDCPAGPPGPAGKAGPKGPTGNAGANGQDGAPGAPGVHGIAGPQGPAGPKGQEGQQGPAGQPGVVKEVPVPAGPPGAPGPAGPQGADGEKRSTGTPRTRRRLWNTRSAWQERRTRRTGTRRRTRTQRRLRPLPRAPHRSRILRISTVHLLFVHCQPPKYKNVKLKLDSRFTSGETDRTLQMELTKNETHDAGSDNDNLV